MPYDAPRLSVVMPSFQQRDFIAEAIDSVFEQGLDDIELIVSDGGSTDGTLTLLADRAERYAGRLRWRSAPDAGPAQAINEAVSRARAPIIGWLNSDDLYSHGAVRRALQHFADHPDCVLVYGVGEHVDIRGGALGTYPSLPPTTPVSAFMHGCFICQPTAFFRRTAFLELGGLTESLRTAFDFDLWLRMFIRFPGRIGWIGEAQALSRLHAGSITLKQRELVALEGIEVLHTHLGMSDSHWILSYFEELLAVHPIAGADSGRAGSLHQQFERTIALARPRIGARGEHEVRMWLAEHRGLSLASDNVGVDVYPDGWTGERLRIRVLQPARPARALMVHGRNARPDNDSLRLRTTLEDSRVLDFAVDGSGEFSLTIPLLDVRPAARYVVTLDCTNAFVPAECERGSDDMRHLGFVLTGLELVRQ